MTDKTKRLMQGLLVAAVLAVGAFWLSTGYARAQEARDCDDNAVIRCGALTIDELKAKWQQNDRNTQAIFAAFGINNASQFDGMVAGRVTGAGEVYVGDRLVATNAQTAGRMDISNENGSSTPIAGGLAYRRSPSVSFVNPSGSLPALVKLGPTNNFQFAVITSCGNPVAASPVPAPAPPPPVAQQTPPPPPPQPQPKRTSFTITKEVRLDGQAAWAENVETQPGGLVDFRIRVRNTGDAELTKVLIRDQLPAGLNFVEDSLTLEGSRIALGDFFGDGINAGSLEPNELVEVQFTAAAASETDACDAEHLTNRAFTRPAYQTEKSDTANVEVCRPEVKAAAETTTLPATGPGETLAIFVAAALGGTALYHFAQRRQTAILP